jgi:hypothetical protein
METRAFWVLERVSDRQLRSDLAALLAAGYRTEARIIAHIAEVEGRKLHARLRASELRRVTIKPLTASGAERDGASTSPA